MANLEELVVEIRGETKQLQAELKAAMGATKEATVEMSKAVEAFSNKSEKNVGFFQQSMATMTGFVGGQAVIGAFNAAKDAVLAFAHSLIVDGVEGAVEAQAAQSSFANALARTGKYSKDAASDFNEFAQSIERTTGVSAEGALSAGKLLATLTSLSGEGLKNATRAALDMSVVLGMDLDSAAKLVAKGMEGNTEAFKKFGISITEGSSKAETASNVLSALNSKFGGAAAAAVQTYSGQLTVLGNSYDDVGKEIGKSIVENQAVTLAMGAVNGIIQEMVGFLEQNQQAMKIWVAEGIVLATTSMGTLMETMNTVAQALKGLATGFEETGVLIGAVAAAAVQAMTGDFAAAAETMKTAFNEAGTAVEDAFTKDTVFAKMSDGLAKVQVAAEAGLAAVKSGADATVKPLNQASTASRELASAQLAAAEAGKALAESLNEQSVSAEDRYTVELELLQMSLETKQVAEDEYWLRRQTLLAERVSAEQAQLTAARNANLVTETQYRAAVVQLETNHTKTLQKMLLEKQKQEDAASKKQIENLQSTFGTISTLSSSHNKALSAIGKTAAIANATIDGYAAVQKALASAPPPFNFALAAAVGVATAANVAKIAGTPLATGITEVPGIGSRDNFPAILAPGEGVLRTETNQELIAFLNEWKRGGQSGGFQGPLRIELSLNGDLANIIEQKTIEMENLSISVRAA